jgi:hypothetical protein
VDRGDAGGPGEPTEEAASGSSGWIGSLAKGLLTGAAVLGIFFLILWLAIVILLSQTMGRGELGSVKSDEVGAYEPFDSSRPLVIRVLTATVDPALDLLKPGTDRIGSATAYLTLQGDLTVSIAAVRLEGDRVVDLEEMSPGRFRDAFPSGCFDEPCSRTYVLVACWTRPTAGGGLSAYMGGSISAGPANDTSPAQVTIDRVPNAVPSRILADLAEATGCAGAS